MSEEDKIRQLFCRFEESGLVEKDVEQFMQCFSTKILGIGMGEQGYVTTLEEVRKVYESGLKTEDTSTHKVSYKRLEVMRIQDNCAIACGDVHVTAKAQDGTGKVINSQFQQTLIMQKEDGEWKICGLHASAPVVTEENMEAFPIRFAEETLHSLREKIGEEVYLQEEQYRKAVLSDTIAFYIINFTKDYIEKCQLQGDICLYTEPGTPYEQFVKEKSPQYVVEEDRDIFMNALSIKNIEECFRSKTNEVSCEYHMDTDKAGCIWLRTIIRLIVDVRSGDKKGIMYVKNIDEEKRMATQIREKAEYDSMTKVLNKGTMIQNINSILKQGDSQYYSVFLMIDVDDFKIVNDTLGHPAGDKVLIKVAEFLSSSFQHSALVGRLGGDEFAVFIHGAKFDDGLRGKINHFVDQVHAFKLDEAPIFSYSVSIGVACLQTDSFQKLYVTADAGLYEVKKAGKNNVVYREESNSI